VPEIFQVSSIMQILKSQRRLDALIKVKCAYYRFNLVWQISTLSLKLLGRPTGASNIPNSVKFAACLRAGATDAPISVKFGMEDHNIGHYRGPNFPAMSWGVVWELSKFSNV